MFELKILTHFAAAHQLKMVTEKCEELHGHNWKIEICVAREKLNKAGVVMDFGIMKQYAREIIAKLDHKFLNDLEFFNDDFPPSSESIAFFIAKQFQEKLEGMPDIKSDVKLLKVTAWESDTASATYHVKA